MARGGDLTKVLDAGELVRIRSLLAENPPPPVVEGALVSYPRMLYHSSYGEAQQVWRDEPNELLKKAAAQKMVVGSHEVRDADEEEEFLLDGWKRSPADFMAVDPRIPTGREARLAQRQGVQSREDEIQALRLRLAELTGSAAPQARAVAPLPPRARRPLRSKRRPSQVAASRAAVAKAAMDPPPTATQVV